MMDVQNQKPCCSRMEVIQVTSVTPTTGLNAVIYPIALISPYKNKWTIKARVLTKTQIFHWANDKGQGRLFSVDLVDNSGGIHATAFNEECDAFYDMLEMNVVYFIKGCTLKLARKLFNPFKNEYEMCFTKYTQIVPCTDDVSSLPGIPLDFHSIRTIVNIPSNSCVVSSFQSTDLMDRQDKEICLVDNTFPNIYFEPLYSIPVEHTLQLRSLSDITTEGFERDITPHYFYCKAYIMVIRREGILYKGCANNGCNKKVVNICNGWYMCEKCGLEFPAFKWKILLRAQIGDTTDRIWVVCFHDIAEKIMEISAERLAVLQAKENQEEFDSVFHKISFRCYIFGLRMKTETYEGNQRLNITVVLANSVSYVAYNHQLLKEVNDAFV